MITITSSIVTDGESLNTGDRNGLWKKFKEEKSANDPNHGPLLKIWRAAHRSNLAYKDIAKSVSEVKITISDVVSVGSYFRVSGVRTQDLKATAISNGLPEPLRWPSFKEVRFAKFSHHLFAVFLRNYRCCMSYWEKENDDESMGFLRKWKNKDKLQTVCVLADVTYILKGLQKSLQKDTCMLSELRKLKDKTIKELESLKDESLTGGWEEMLISNIDSENKFYGIQLDESRRRTSSVNLYVPDRRSFSAIRTEIVDSLRNFLDECLSIDDELTDVVGVLSPQNFSKLSKENVKAVQQVLLPDFELREVSRSLSVVADVISGMESYITHFQLLQHLIPSNDEEYKPVIVALARIVAAKPHSMDVERLVSSYNLIKSTDRSSLSGDTLQDYLVVRHNMPCTAKFDVREAVDVWMSRAQRKPRYDRDITKFMHQEYVTAFFGTSCSNTNSDSSTPPVVKI